MSHNASTRPILWLPDKPQFKRGRLFGLPLPVCTFSIACRHGALTTLARPMQALANCLGEISPEAKQGPEVVFIATSIAFWVWRLQALCGVVTSQERWMGHPSILGNGTSHVALAVPYLHPQALFDSLNFILKFMNDALTARARESALVFHLDGIKESLQRFREPGQNTVYLLEAAMDLKLPITRIAPQTYRFGYGQAQRVFCSTFSDKTSVIGSRLSRNKQQTASILRAAGLPGAIHTRVSSEQQAMAEARRIGYPVVIKPADADGGEGVSADLRTEHDIQKAYAAARRVSPNVLIEPHVNGTGHRFTVVFGRLVKVTAKQPWGVTGDGLLSVEQLVERQGSQQTQEEPAAQARRKPSVLDEEALSLLAQYELTPGSIPVAGRFLPLRRRNNAAVGGSSARLALDMVHPDNLDLALRTARLLMLDIAGIDLIIQDITRSWFEQESLICEVNSQPQTDRQTIAAMLAQATHETCRIPVTLIVVPGTEQLPEAAQVAKLAAALGVQGVSSAAGVWVNGMPACLPGDDGFSAAQRLLMLPDVASAAICLTAEELGTQGLPVDRFDQLMVASSRDREQAQALTPVHKAGSITMQEVITSIEEQWPQQQHKAGQAMVGRIWPHFAPL